MAGNAETEPRRSGPAARRRRPSASALALALIAIRLAGPAAALPLLLPTLAAHAAEGDDDKGGDSDKSDDGGGSDDGGSDDGGSDDGGSDDGGSDDGGNDDGGDDDGGSDGGGDDDGGDDKSGVVPPVKAAAAPVIWPRAVRSDGRPTYAEGELVASGLSPRTLDALQAKGYRLLAAAGGGLDKPVYRLALPRGTGLSDGARTVRQLDRGAVTAPNDFYYPDTGRSACKGPSCAAATLVGWPADTARRCGRLPLIGVIDTGIDLRHPALAGQAVDVATDRGGAQAASGTGHGTAVVALLAGRADSPTPGLLPGATIAAVDAFYRDGGVSDRTDVATLVNALDTLVSRGAGVINLSLSGPPNPILESAIRQAVKRDVVIVSAAGNGGKGAPPAYPAAYDGVIAVTAVDAGLHLYARANQGDYVDLAAPGVDVWTAGSGRRGERRSGTSFAVPYVTAAAALVRAAHPGIRAPDVAARLAAGARDLGPAGHDPAFGDGLLGAADLCRADAGTAVAARRSAQVFTPADGD